MSTTTATVTIATLAIVCVFATMIWATVTLRQALRSITHAMTNMQQRHDHQIDNLLDRLTTIKWEDFAALQAIQGSEEEGGFLTPEEQATEAKAEVQVEEADRWGPLSRASRQRALTDQETQLLQEDFPDESR